MSKISETIDWLNHPLSREAKQLQIKLEKLEKFNGTISSFLLNKEPFAFQTHFKSIPFCNGIILETDIERIDKELNLSRSQEVSLRRLVDVLIKRQDVIKEILDITTLIEYNLPSKWFLSGFRQQLTIPSVFSGISC